MNRTQVFRILSQTEPFSTVSSSAKYRECRMHNDDQAAFWREGRDCVTDLHTVVGEETFDSVLDYGCGIGRLLSAFQSSLRPQVALEAT